MKRRVIISNKKGIYELHHDMSSDFPAGIYSPPLKSTTATLEHGVKYAQSQQQGHQKDAHRQPWTHLTTRPSAPIGKSKYAIVDWAKT